MEKTLKINDIEIKYTFTYKNVKNINLRIKPDGTVFVSANKRFSQKVIDSFLESRKDFILNALDKFKKEMNTPKTKYCSESELKEIILIYCEKYFPYYKNKGIKYPEIKFRRMVSRWGSCHPARRILTFNLNLVYAPPACVEYVVLHEFTHFLQANHSVLFYKELEKVCPWWKEARKELKEINIR